MARIANPTYQDLIYALEKASENTTTDPRWLAACELRRIWPIHLRRLEIRITEGDEDAN
jgi:hypothetical protein